MFANALKASRTLVSTVFVTRVDETIALHSDAANRERTNVGPNDDVAVVPGACAAISRRRSITTK